MSVNYSEDLFQAIETIVQKNLSEISFDRTIVAEIQSKGNIPNKYWVQNNGVSFEAYTLEEHNIKYILKEDGTLEENKVEYNIGDKIYVLIPEGNFSNKKIILGKQLEENNRIEYNKGIFSENKISLIKNPEILNTENKTIELEEELDVLMGEKIGLEIIFNFPYSFIDKIYLLLTYEDGKTQSSSITKNLIIGNPSYIFKLQKIIYSSYNKITKIKISFPNQKTQIDIKEINLYKIEGSVIA